MKAIITERLNTILKEAKRPFACLLVLCLVVTLIPVINLKAEIAAVHADTVSSPTFSGNTWTINSNTVLDSNSDVTIPANSTIEISENSTLTICNNLKIQDNVTICGPGTLIVSGASIILAEGTLNSATLNINNINICGGQHNKALFYYESADAHENIVFENVTISGIQVLNDRDATVLRLNSAVMATMRGCVNLSGNTGGSGTVLFAGSNNAILNVEGKVIISNSGSDMPEAGIAFESSSPGKVYVTNQLEDGSSIAIKKGTRSVSPISCAAIVDVASARDAFYVSDQFHDWGVEESGTDINFEEKSAMTINFTGEGSVEAYDTHNRSIVSGSNGTSFTVKEIPGREVKMNFVPANSTHFVKTVTIAGTNITNDLTSYDSYKRSTTFSAVNGGIHAVAFEQAVTSVDLNGIIAPSSFMEAEDSLEHAAIGLCTPASASLTLVDKAWYSSSGGNMTLMGGTEKFVQDQHYILVATLSALGGSQFAPTVAVSAAGVSANCTASGSPALTTLSVSIEYTATKMLLSLAETLGYVTFTTNATAGNATYDGQPHGPTITMRDVNGGFVDSASTATVNSSSANYTVTTAAGTENTVISTITINGPAAAGSYTAEADIGNTIYEGTHTFTGLSYTIAKRTITPDGVLNIASARKYYDGTPAVTSTGLSITFAGVVDGDDLTGMYTASYAFDSADAGDRTIRASAISLTAGTAANNNYILGGNTVNQAGATILKVTPRERSGSIEFIPVIAEGTKLSDIAFKVSETQANWFENIYAALNTSPRNVSGSAVLIEEGNDLNLAPQRSDLSTTNIEKNHAYPWRFIPSDLTNYENVVGSTVFWPVAPIKNISLSGITLPVPGATNNITTNAVSGVTVAAIGPSSGCEITIVSAEWKEHNPNTNSDFTLNVGDKFKYNRTYTLELTMNASATDKFATGGALAVDFTTDGATRNMTSISVSETQAKFSYSFVIGKGTLTDSMFAVPADLTAANAVTYKGIAYNCTIASIVAEIDDDYLEYRTNNGNWSSWTSISSINGLTGYKDASDVNYTYTIQIRHPDYNGTLTKTYDIKINKKPIDTSSIEFVETRPYNNTSMVNVTIGSIDIVAGDDIVLTADSGTGCATISNPNYSTSSVMVTANDIIMSGSSSGNYILTDPAKTATRAYPTGGIIQKVTPTGGSITFAAVTTAYPQYSQLNVSPQGFVNEYITGANGVAGTIVSYVDSGYGTTVGAAQLNTTLVKRHPYYWKFFPTDSTNYNVVEGGPVQYWPGAPITNATLTGIVLPVATANPTAQNQISLELNDPTANITVSAISWNETSDIEGVSDRAIGPADTFYYNRYHILTITLSAVGEGGAAPVDEFNDEAAMLIPTFAGIINIGGQLQPCVTEIVKTNGKAYTAVITCSFGGVKTDKGTLTNDNLDARDFASYYRDGTLYKNDLRGEGNLLTYVYTGRRVGPYPKSVSLQAVDIQSIKYSTGGGLFNEEVPLYSEVMSNGQPKDIQIQLTHPDYNGTIEKDVQLYIGPCYVRAEGVIYGGKYYDGTKDIDANVAKILWAPTLAQSSTNEGITSEEIGRLITYDAQYEFGDERAGSAKDVYVSNIHFISTNFLPQYANIPEKGIGDAVGNQVNGSFTYHSSAPSATPIPISKAAVTPKTGSILKQPINSAVSLSAVYTDYIINHSNASTGAVMVNAVRSSLDVHGSLDFMSGGAIMSYADMDSATLVQGQAYTWCFTPTDAVNYAVTTGTQILWPFPPPTPSYGGGGGGGGAAAPTKAAVSTLSGVIATPGSFSTQIHVYWASGGSIVTDKAFLARVTGAAVDRALTAMPDGNIVVDRDGNIIVKAIIEGGMVKAYLTGDNYLTVQRRKVDYIDVPGHWFEPYVDFCSARDIMNGTGESKFSPNDTLTRAMAATIIYRLEGALALDGSERHFADVEDGKWYSDGIAWAGGNGIVNGIGIKNFAPHWDITREQLAVMIYNYCRTRCGAEAVPSGYFDARLYNDGGQIASWAQEAVAYCSKVGLMKGNDKGDFCPKDTATRAEFATITQRLIEAFLDGKL